ncbi:Uncharacterized protein dnm_063200 [Desulfonema magnum]|uniref:Uncharacterized protein n=1 Tax=Desulfonema magnum TaxID=45655 RepID=A0A975BR04_9BACT|nr:Uncharacterized protein dnm_063200 [Desulfonema magnum]
MKEKVGHETPGGAVISGTEKLLFQVVNAPDAGKGHGKL